MRECFDGCFGCVVDRVAGHVQRERRAREVDDAAAVAHACRRFAQRVEGAAQVDVERLVEQGVRGVGERHGLQHAGVVHEHVDLAELLFADLEHVAYLVGLGDVGFHGDRLRACGFQFGDQRVGFVRAGCVVDDYGETVAGETAGDSCADAARSAGDESDFGRGVCGVHDSFPQGGWFGATRLSLLGLLGASLERGGSVR
jgi:hypothetical protein